MDKPFSQIVSDLVGCGYAFMPIDIDLLESAESGARIFLLSQVDNWRDWNFVSDDLMSLGIIEEHAASAGVATDTRRALSFTHNLPRRKVADDPHTKECLGKVSELYRDMRRRVTEVCQELQRHCGSADIVTRIRSTFELGDVRPSSLQLRSSICGRRSLTGAMQSDSVLSMYFASEDSEIWLKDEKIEKWALRSPPYGNVLMFFGLRVGELGNPAFKPATYRVDAHSGKPPRNTILHIQIKEEVTLLGGADNVHTLMA